MWVETLSCIEHSKSPSSYYSRTTVFHLFVDMLAHSSLELERRYTYFTMH